jgi:hypothetical protein
VAVPDITIGCIPYRADKDGNSGIHSSFKLDCECLAKKRIVSVPNGVW